MAVDLIATTNGKGSKNIAGYPGMSITETIINGFFTVDHKWTVKYWNKAAELLLGVTAEEIVGKNIWEEFAGIIPLNFYTVYQKAFLQDIPIHFKEYWAEKGTWFDVVTCHSYNTLSVSFKSSSQPSYSAPPQQQLKILNELYRYVTEVTNDCLWEWCLETGEIFWIDGGHKRLFGYQVENALVSQSFWESRIHPDDKPGLLSSLNKVIATGAAVWEYEYRFKKADETYSYVHDRGHIIYEESGDAKRMIGATQDISSRKLTEIKLLASERRLAVIARQSMNSIIMTDKEEKISWVNDAFTRVTGYEPEEVLGKKPSFLQGKNTDQRTIEYLQKKIQDKQPFDCDIVNYTKSGEEYWVHLHGQPLTDTNGHFEQYFALQTNITEKVLMENKLVRLRKEQQKETTAAMLEAHENERASIALELHDNLNQILAVAKLYIQMAATYEDKRGVYLENATGFIVRVIEEIRKISKTFAVPGLHGMGLRDSISNAINDLQEVHAIKIDFDTNITQEEDIDKRLQITIFRIVQEQLKNIIKHSEASTAVINLNRQENSVLLFISDNGKGLDASRETKGVGIVNVRTRVELHDGKVSNDSLPGKGYELKVLFPLNTPAQ